MAQEWAKGFYNSRLWQQCRAGFIAERIRLDGGMCQDCHERLGEIAHHWPQPLTAHNVTDPAVALSWANLRWVCKECHDLYPGHGVNKPITPVLQFDANGDPIPPPIKNS